jgi:molybdopterin converting factor small subunit
LKVELNLYASLRRFLPAEGGGTTCTLEIDEGKTIGDLLKRLNVPLDTVKVVFLNGVHAEMKEGLNDGDRVGVFPPVGGG